MFKLVLEKAEEPQIKLPTSVGSLRKQESLERYLLLLYSLSFIDYALFDCIDHNKVWKILKVMGIADHLTCLLRSLCAGQKAAVRTVHETGHWFQIGK